MSKILNAILRKAKGAVILQADEDEEGTPIYTAVYGSTEHLTTGTSLYGYEDAVENMLVNALEGKTNDITGILAEEGIVGYTDEDDDDGTAPPDYVGGPSPERTQTYKEFSPEDEEKFLRLDDCFLPSAQLSGCSKGDSK